MSIDFGKYNHRIFEKLAPKYSVPVVPVSVGILSAFNPYISGGGHGKDEQEEDKQARLQVVSCHRFSSKQDRTQQFT